MPSGIGRLVSSTIPERAYDESTESICRKGTYQASENESCRAQRLCRMKLPAIDATKDAERQVRVS